MPIPDADAKEQIKIDVSDGNLWIITMHPDGQSKVIEKYTINADDCKTLTPAEGSVKSAKIGLLASESSACATEAIFVLQRGMGGVLKTFPGSSYPKS